MLVAPINNCLALVQLLAVRSFTGTSRRASASAALRSRTIRRAPGVPRPLARLSPTSALCPRLQIFCVDYRADGLAFATAGKQTCVRVYDEGTRAVTATLSGGVSGVTPGHSNRIFSLKFDPNDDNTVVSAGWDNTVQVGTPAGAAEGT